MWCGDACVALGCVNPTVGDASVPTPPIRRPRPYKMDSPIII